MGTRARLSLRLAVDVETWQVRATYAFRPLQNVQTLAPPSSAGALTAARATFARHWAKVCARSVNARAAVACVCGHTRVRQNAGFSGSELASAAGKLTEGHLHAHMVPSVPCLPAVHAELVLSDVEEVNLDGVLEALCKVIAADHTLGGGVSIAKMKADYEEMLIKNAAAASSSKDGVALTRKTAAELGTVKSEQALKAVREDMGPFNWFVQSALVLP